MRGLLRSVATAGLVGSCSGAQTIPCEGALVNQQRCGCASDQISYNVYAAGLYEDIYEPPASEVYSSPKLVKGTVPDTCLSKCRNDMDGCEAVRVSTKNASDSGGPGVRSVDHVSCYYYSAADCRSCERGQDCYTLDSPFFTESCSARGDYWVDTSAGRLSWTNFCVEEETLDVLTIVGIVGMVGVALIGCRLVKLVRDKQAARAEFDTLMHGGAVAIGTPESPDHRSTRGGRASNEAALNEAALDFNADEHQTRPVAHVRGRDATARVTVGKVAEAHTLWSPSSNSRGRGGRGGRGGGGGRDSSNSGRVIVATAVIATPAVAARNRTMPTALAAAVATPVRNSSPPRRSSRAVDL